MIPFRTLDGGCLATSSAALAIPSYKFTVSKQVVLLLLGRSLGISIVKGPFLFFMESRETR